MDGVMDHTVRGSEEREVHAAADHGEQADPGSTVPRSNTHVHTHTHKHTHTHTIWTILPAFFVTASSMPVCPLPVVGHSARLLRRQPPASIKDPMEERATPAARVSSVHPRPQPVHHCRPGRSVHTGCRDKEPGRAAKAIQAAGPVYKICPAAKDGTHNAPRQQDTEFALGRDVESTRRGIQDPEYIQRLEDTQSIQFVQGRNTIRQVPRIGYEIKPDCRAGMQNRTQKAPSLQGRGRRVHTSGRDKSIRALACTRDSPGMQMQCIQSD